MNKQFCLQPLGDFIESVYLKNIPSSFSFIANKQITDTKQYLCNSQTFWFHETHLNQIKLHQQSTH